jgi:hypothetical protein
MSDVTRILNAVERGYYKSEDRGRTISMRKREAGKPPMSGGDWSIRRKDT